MLLNADTGELIPFSSYTAPPNGKWMLRRPLSLSESTRPLFLEVRLIPGIMTVRKSGEASNQPRQQVGLQPTVGATLPHAPSQQSL